VHALGGTQLKVLVACGVTLRQALAEVRARRQGAPRAAAGSAPSASKTVRVRSARYGARRPRKLPGRARFARQLFGGPLGQHLPRASAQPSSEA
jgi:hypothetical protein